PAQLKHTPGPYPKTEEERKKAAEKYNLHIDDYKPFPNDHRHSGDYPDLPWISYDARDPFYPWDMPAMRRNYGEPIHKFNDQMLGDKYDYGVRKHISDQKATLIFWAIFLSIIVIGRVLGDTSQPFMEKQVPGKGEHYTFELIK
ncbi:NADH dehydrogenase [ubiquinone] 1 beta subcomplex subunit 8, mitochondrial-like, partial [Ceratina calcarata]